MCKRWYEQYSDVMQFMCTFMIFGRPLKIYEWENMFRHICLFRETFWQSKSALRKYEMEVWLPNKVRTIYKGVTHLKINGILKKIQHWAKCVMSYGYFMCLWINIYGMAVVILNMCSDKILDRWYKYGSVTWMHQKPS